MKRISWDTIHERLPTQRSLSLSLRVLVTVVLFLFAIRLLRSSTDALAPLLSRILRQVVVGDWSALGISWLASYVLANGTIVAALALSLFDSDLIAPSQLFLMIVGSRLGAAAIVVLIGAFDYAHDEIDSLRESVSLGLLTFLLTHTIYLPVLVLGYVAIPWVLPSVLERTGVRPETEIPDAFSTVAERTIESVGAEVAFVAAIGAIFLSMRLFDSILKQVDIQRLRGRYLSRLNNKWISFGLGLLVTGLTTSVAFSLGVVVPLYNRGHVKRNEIIPYVLGANIGTLVDTLVVAVALGTTVGVMTVVLLLALGLLVTMLALLLYLPYTRFVDGVQNEIVGTVAYFVGFLVSLLLVPLLLVVLR
ncbi:sodium:phosphate symporter [Haladaptatus sp. NG-WS-4]